MNSENLYNNFRDNGIVTLDNLIDADTIKDIKQKPIINIRIIKSY